MKAHTANRTATPVSPRSPAKAPPPSDDLTSVAGEEDPGAAIDPPSPPARKPTDLRQARPPSPGNLVNRTPRTAGSVPQESADDHLQLPHERDQDSDMTDGETRPVIEQAAKDLARGLVDTDMRATPGLDAEKRQRDVPGAGGRHTRKDSAGPRR